MDTPGPEPTWFGDDGQMNLEAQPEQHVPSDFAKRMAEAEVSRAHKTTLVEGDFSPDDRPILPDEVHGSVHMRALIYDSARTGCYLIPHRQLEIFLRATRFMFDAIVEKNPSLKAAVADGRMQANIRKPMPAGSRLGLFMVAAGHGWSPAMLAKHLVVEDAMRAGQADQKAGLLADAAADKDRL